ACARTGRNALSLRARTAGDRFMSYAHITLPRLLLSLGLIAVAIALSRRSRLGLEGDLLWGAVRGAAQLIAIGYVLLLLFNHEHPAWVLLLLTVMLVVAGATAARRVEHGPPRRVLFPRAIAAIGAGAAGARDAPGGAPADDQRPAHGGSGRAPGHDDRADRQRHPARAGGPVSDRDPLSARGSGGGGRHDRGGVRTAPSLHRTGAT